MQFPNHPVKHSFITLQTNIQLHITELNSIKPSIGTVILIHGFPDIWYGWRKQIRCIANLGYNVIVPDMIGYGNSDCPKQIERYSMQSITRDLCALLDTFLLDNAIFLGHDWGGTVVWNMAITFPSRVSAVGSVCTPFFPCNPNKNPLHQMQINPGRFDYQLWFQTKQAQDELEKNIKRSIQLLIRGTDLNDQIQIKMFSQKPTQQGGLFVGLPDPAPASCLLTDQELQFYVDQFEKSGFEGPLNWYRNIENNWKWLIPTSQKKILQPALMVTVGRDAIFTPNMIDGIDKWVPNISIEHVEEAGHWVLQEKPEQINKIICNWLEKIKKQQAAKL